MFTYSNSRRFWTMVSRMSFAVSIANYSVEFCSRIIVIPEKSTHESALWPTMADKECRPSRVSCNCSGSTANPDHNICDQCVPDGLRAVFARGRRLFLSAEPTASERRRRRARRVMGRSCAGSFIRARTRPNRRSAHGFGRFFCSPPRRLRYAGRFCPLPPRAPIYGTVRPQSAFSGGEGRDMRGEKGGCK